MRDKISPACVRFMIRAFQTPEHRQIFIPNTGPPQNFVIEMTGRTVQRSVEKNLCSKCLNVAIGTRVKGGFLCEECIRVFMIRKQLWVYPIQLRDQIIVDEGLKRR